MKLNSTDQAVLEFLDEPRTSIEIQEHFGYRSIPYHSLRLLQRLDLIDKLESTKAPKVKYVQSGRGMVVAKKEEKVWHTVFGVRI